MGVCVLNISDWLQTLCFYSRHYFNHPLFGNLDQQTDYFRAVLITVLCGMSLMAAQEVTVNPILFKIQALKMPVNGD